MAWLGGYDWGKWLRLDVIADISVAALLIPESMGDAGIAGLPPEGVALGVLYIKHVNPSSVAVVGNIPWGFAVAQG